MTWYIPLSVWFCAILPLSNETRNAVSVSAAVVGTLSALVIDLMIFDREQLVLGPVA